MNRSHNKCLLCQSLLYFYIINYSFLIPQHPVAIVSTQSSLNLGLYVNSEPAFLCFSLVHSFISVFCHSFLLERDHVTFGYLLSQIPLSVVCDVRAPYSSSRVTPGLPVLGHRSYI